MSDMTPCPLGKRVLLVKGEAAETSSGGIILPSDSREQPLEARVVAVGQEVTQVAKGDTIIYASFAGTTFTIGDQDVIVVDEEDIMLVLREVVETEDEFTRRIREEYPETENDD
jgi:chaperonin GroES